MDSRALLSVAENAARAAGERLLQGAAELRQVTFEDRNDVKLKADVESEHLIRDMLAAADASIRIVGEELGGDDSLTQKEELYWVVDPLDGTFNYLRGMPVCAVSIGLLRGTDPVLGVIYDFNRDVCYSGGPDLGFSINGKEGNLGWADSRDQAALLTGLPAGWDRESGEMDAWVSTMMEFKKVRMIGSAALALACVASGQGDAYLENSIRLWDVAAGLALVAGAGGVVRLAPSSNGKFLAYDVQAAGREDLLPVDLAH